MKAQCKIKQLWLTLTLVGASTFGFLPAAHASKLGLSADYPVAAGNIGQDFTSNLGATLSFYPDPFLDPKIDNFVSVGYYSLTVRADAESSYRILPILVGIELPGKVFEDLKTTFAIGAGAALTYINVPNLNSIKINPYFAAEIKPGLAWEFEKGFALTAQVPITWLFSSKPLTYIAYSIGLEYNFGKEESPHGKR